MEKLYEILIKIPIVNKFLKRFFTPETFGQFVRYIIVGVVSFSIEYTLFIVLRNIMAVNEITVNIIVYTVIFWLNFLLNKFYSFQSRTNFKRQLLLYGVLFLFNLLVGNVLLFSAIRHALVLVSGEGSWPVLYLPKILIMFFIITWNFILYKKVIYK
jgi:putative flippase GtrA